MASHDKPWIRTPLVHSRALSLAAGCKVFLKLENIQPAGSFKSRGVGNYMLRKVEALENSTPNNDADRHASSVHFYSSSGGNAGLAAAACARSLNKQITVVVPMTTSHAMMEKIRAAGAGDVIQIGKSWVEADAHLREVLMPAAKTRGETPMYVPPFDHQTIWDGNATIIDELLQDLDGPPDAIIASVGGGGLFSGLMTGLGNHSIRDRVPVLAVETNGTDSLASSLAAGQLVTLPAITSVAKCLGARTVAAQCFEFGQAPNVTSVVVEDPDAIAAVVRFLDEERMMVEPACGAAVAVAYNGERLHKLLNNLSSESRVVLIVCGGSDVSFAQIEEWKRDFGY